MILVDTHAHLDADEFEKDRSEVILRAKESGLAYILSIAIDLETSYKNLEIAEQYPFIYTSCGLHPNYGYKWEASLEKEFRKLTENPNVLAIGEAGLDFFREYCPYDKQVEVFEKQMQLARETDLPIILHCRDAHEELIKRCKKAYQDWGTLKGVIHCFSGGPEEAEQYIEMGFYLSFAGPVTYKKSDALREALKNIPKDRILVETDCPYLSPQPRRGKRNEPSFVKMTAEGMAKELEMEEEEFGQITTENAIRLFKIPVGEND